MGKGNVYTPIFVYIIIFLLKILLNNGCRVVNNNCVTIFDFFASNDSHIKLYLREAIEYQAHLISPLIKYKLLLREFKVAMNFIFLLLDEIAFSLFPRKFKFSISNPAISNLKFYI